LVEGLDENPYIHYIVEISSKAPDRGFLMRAMYKTAIAAILSLSFGVGVSAHAHSVSLKVTGVNSGAKSVPLSQPDFGGHVTAGQISLLTSDKQSFAAYCVELTQPTSSSFQTYDIGSFSGSQASQLEGLFSATSLYGGASKIDTSIEYAAFQVAVWEITHETSAQRNVSLFKGSLYVVGLSSTDLGIAAKANTYLADALAYSGPALFNVYKLSNSKYQDLVVATSVPELDRTAMMALGLGVMGLAVRRRQSR
jgi:hypothetical protein